MTKINLLAIFMIFTLNIFSQSNPEIIMKLGVSEVQNGNFQASLQYFDKIIKIDKNNIQAYTLRGYAKSQLNDFSGCISDFSTIIQLQPNNSDAYDKRGICLKSNNENDKALKDYNKAIELDENNATAYYNRGVLKYFSLNDEIGACADWKISSNLGYEKALYIRNDKCGDDNGAIKTQEGMLLYFNVEKHHYTLNLVGSIDLSAYPLIKQDQEWFEFVVNDKSEFTQKSPDIFKNYMNWEVDYLEEKFKTKIKTENEVISIEGIDVNFWHFETPKMDINVEHTPVIMNYFADFVYRDLVFRFSYPSVTKDEKSAKTLLTALVNNIKFYSSPIDLSKLQRGIKSGVNYYID